MKRIAHSTGLDHDGVDELLLASKQDALNVNGQPISTTVLDTFQLAANGDGTGYATSLVSARAIENWFEMMQQSMILAPVGQQGGIREGLPGLATLSPSGQNVPSCAAVRTFIEQRVQTLNTKITDLSNNVNNCLTAIPSEYVTETELDNYTFDTLDLSSCELSGFAYDNSGGLAILNPQSNAYMPIFCSDVHIGGDGGNPMATNSLNSLLFEVAGRFNDYIQKPYSSFVFPASGYLTEVSGNLLYLPIRGVDEGLNGHEVTFTSNLATGRAVVNYASANFMPNKTFHTNNVNDSNGIAAASVVHDGLASKLNTTGGSLSGDLTVNGHLLVNGDPSNTDNLKIGDLGGLGYAGLATEANFNETDYALAQVHSSGSTVLNAKVGGDILFTKGGASATVGKWDSNNNFEFTTNTTSVTIQNGLTVNGSFKVKGTPSSTDNMQIGDPGFNGFGGLATEANFNTTDYALVQSHSTGSVVLNAKASGSLLFAKGGVSLGGWDANNDLELNNNTNSVTIQNDLTVNGTITGSTISGVVPIPATGVGARKCVIRNANDDGWTFSDVNLDISYRTDNINTAADWKVPSVLGVKNYALTEFDPDFSVTRNSVGNYTITFATTHTNHYCISLTTETIITGVGVGTTQHLDDYMIVYYSKSSSGFGVYVKEQDDGGSNGTFRDVKFDFMCVSRGKVFCHGSINGFLGTILTTL
jgi:hypothetical protein